MDKHIKVIAFRVGQVPVVVEMGIELAAWQAFVGGHVEIVGLGDGCVLFANEEGAIDGSPYNRSVRARAPELPPGFTLDDVIDATGGEAAAPGEMGWHHIHGDFFIAREIDTDEGADFVDVTPDDITRYINADAARTIAELHQEEA